MTDPMREAYEYDLEQAYWDFKAGENPLGLSERDRFKMQVRALCNKQRDLIDILQITADERLVELSEMLKEHSQPRMTEEEVAGLIARAITIRRGARWVTSGRRKDAEAAAKLILAKLPVQNNQPHDNKEADSQINLSEDDLLKIVSDYVKKEPLAEGVNAFHVKVIYNALINSAKKE